MTGGRSHPRFLRLAGRMVDVMPQAKSVVFTQRSHVDPPHRSEPDRLADLLMRLWWSA